MESSLRCRATRAVDDGFPPEAYLISLQPQSLTPIIKPCTAPAHADNFSLPATSPPHSSPPPSSTNHASSLESPACLQSVSTAVVTISHNQYLFQGASVASFIETGLLKSTSSQLSSPCSESLLRLYSLQASSAKLPVFPTVTSTISYKTHLVTTNFSRAGFSPTYTALFTSTTNSILDAKSHYHFHHEPPERWLRCLHGLEQLKAAEIEFNKSTRLRQDRHDEHPICQNRRSDEGEGLDS